ncbi:E3 ORFA [Polar bear adenovirus 1]|uniref:E3 ORFA n=1 Tax=Polar bear adenovirus 1 TaxID=2250215 RepID=A0A345S513_9ADEN|nr:E3 ORFA [Polar bear adenovirus 1]AXI68666.1 E3 ORFA [Polar bear adenovirus 1]
MPWTVTTSSIFFTCFFGVCKGSQYEVTFALKNASALLDLATADLADIEWRNQLGETIAVTRNTSRQCKILNCVLFPNGSLQLLNVTEGTSGLYFAIMESPSNSYIFEVFNLTVVDALPNITVDVATTGGELRQSLHEDLPFQTDSEIFLVLSLLLFFAVATYFLCKHKAAKETYNIILSIGIYITQWKSPRTPLRMDNLQSKPLYL